MKLSNLKATSLLIICMLAISANASNASSFENKTVGQFILENRIDCKRLSDSGDFSCRNYRRKDEKKVKQEASSIEAEMLRLSRNIHDSRIKLNPQSESYDSEKKAIELKRKSLKKLKRYRGNLHKLYYAMRDAQAQAKLSQEKPEPEQENNAPENNNASFLQQLLPLFTN